jgi:hypothetical protein
VVIGNGVTSIGGKAFYTCTQLKSVTIPASVTSIENSAFSGSPLSEVYFEGDAPEVGYSVFSSNPLLYYIQGKEGWTTPTWNGYRTATWPPLLTYEHKDGMLLLTYSGGILQESSDLIQWSVVDVTQEGEYELELPAAGSKYYRVAQ